MLTSWNGASAGAASFRRQPALKRCLKAARAQIAELNSAERDPQSSARALAAQKRAAHEYEARCEQALEQFEQLSAHQAQTQTPVQRGTETRISTTDPEARVMKMADGGFRPAYNLQFATDSESRIIVGVGATNSGADSGQLEPMQAEIERRTNALPRQQLADGGYHNFAAVERSAARGIAVFSPLRHNRTYRIDPLAPQPGDSPAIAAYRRRMASAAGKQIYQQRAATAETVNADLKAWRGLDRLLVRGSAKVLTVAIWAALAYHLMRAIKLGWL